MRHALLVGLAVLVGCGPAVPPTTIDMAVEPDATAAYVLSGKITAKGAPLAGARVRVQASSDVDATSFVSTATDGTFKLTLPGAAAGDRIAVTAGAVGWKTAEVTSALPVGGTAATVDLKPVPTDDPSYAFQSVEIGNPPCNFCHFDQTDQWTSSQHSKAAKDPLTLDEYRNYAAWWQHLDTYNATEAEAFAGPFLTPDKKGDVGAFFLEGSQRYKVLGDDATLGDCAKCHVPTYAAAGGADFRPSVLATQSKVFSEGVSCDFCHKVKNVRTATETDLRAPGIDKDELARPPVGEQVMFGQYDDVTYSLMGASYSPLLRSSDLCADCHSDAKVIHLQPVDGSGASTGAAVERLIWGEDTYREWRFASTTVLGVHTAGVMSASGDGPFTTSNNYAGRPLQCQDCHMQDPPPDTKTGESIVDWADPKSSSSRIATSAEAVKRDPRTVYPHRFKGRTARFVAWATELAATGARASGEIAIDVTVENRHTGHFFPTGLPDRNVLLVVEARDAGGQPLAQTSGPKLPAWASGDGVTDPTRDLAGRPGKGFARVLVAADGEVPVFYLRAVGDGAADTRLLPGAIDKTSYRFTAPSSGAATVTVRLLHRLRFKPQLDRFLKRNPTTDPTTLETPGDTLTVTVP